MSGKKRNPESLESHEDEQTIDYLAEAVADGWLDATLEDPFELYVQLYRSKLCKDRHSFRGKLRRGYRALLEIIKNKKD